MRQTERLLSELIALPSVNPAFLPAGSPQAGERRVAQFLAATGARAGLDLTFQPVLPGRENVVLRLTPPGAVRQRVLLAPHLDTVDGTGEQFRPRKRRGRLYGRGASDTKGSVAAMVAALCELAASGPRPAQTEILFVGLVDEENSQAGSRAFARGPLKADLAIVGEPTELKVVTAHKGSLWLRLQTRGRSAHGSRPDLGRNAVHEMARIVDLLQTEYAAGLARRRHPLLGPATVNVGVIAGGTQPNIVPDQCSITVDRRTLPGETQTGVWRQMRALLATRGLRARCGDDKQAPCLPLETDPKLPLVRQLLRVMGQRRPAGVHYFCDAAVLAQARIPSVVFGPGSIAQAHTADEWVDLAAVDAARARLAHFLRSLP